MKINITKAELLGIMSEYFKQQITEVVISKPLTNELERQFAKALGVHAITPSTIGGANKIPAIKALRTVTSCGLAEAKYAVENWDRFFKEVKRLGRMPVFHGEIFSPEGPKFS